MTRLTSFAVAVLGLTFASATLAAGVPGNAAAGAEKAKPCAACHGADGNTTLDDSYPKLGGQHPDYLVQALKDYRSGARQNAIMKGFAENLTDEDIADLAVYFGSQKAQIQDLSGTEGN
jgi:cytochrome c553